MNLKEDDPKEIEKLYPGSVIVKTAFAEIDARKVDALNFFNPVDPSYANKTGECSGIPVQAELILEGVLDEDSPSN